MVLEKTCFKIGFEVFKNSYLIYKKSGASKIKSSDRLSKDRRGIHRVTTSGTVSDNE